MVSNKFGRFADDTTPTWQSCLVFAPGWPMSPSDLRRRIAHRQLLSTDDGTGIVLVSRRSGSTCEIVHSKSDFAIRGHPFREAMIVQAYADGRVRIWGDYDGIRGVWTLEGNADPVLVSRMDRVDAFVPSPCGIIVLGTRDGYKLYVFPNSEALVPGGTNLILDGQGVPHGLIPYGELVPRKRREASRTGWILCSSMTHRGEAPNTDVIYPHWFQADRVEPHLFRDRLLCIVRNNGTDAYWRQKLVSRNGVFKLEDELTEMTPEGTEGGVDFIWVSPDGLSSAELLRIPNRGSGFQRRLLLNSSSTVYEGMFCMNPDGFHWSPDGCHYVAHLRLLDSDHNLRDEIIVASGDRRISVHGMAYEQAVDNQGHVAYLLEGALGRSIACDGTLSSVFPHAWNLRHGANGVLANVLMDGKIYRTELPYAR